MISKADANRPRYTDFISAVKGYSKDWMQLNIVQLDAAIRLLANEFQVGVRIFWYQVHSPSMNGSSSDWICCKSMGDEYQLEIYQSTLGILGNGSILVDQVIQQLNQLARADCTGDLEDVLFQRLNAFNHLMIDAFLNQYKFMRHHSSLDVDINDPYHYLPKDVLERLKPIVVQLSCFNQLSIQQVAFIIKHLFMFDDVQYNMFAHHRLQLLDTDNRLYDLNLSTDSNAGVNWPLLGSCQNVIGYTVNWKVCLSASKWKAFFNTAVAIERHKVCTIRLCALKRLLHQLIPNGIMHHVSFEVSKDLVEKAVLSSSGFLGLNMTI